MDRYKVEGPVEAHIDSLIFGDVLIHGQKLTILGYTDAVGSKRHNDTLSMQRARSVADYLVSSGFDSRDITLYTGLGEVARNGESKDGFAADRKVAIVIDKTPHKAAPPPAVVPAPAKDTTHKPNTVAHDLKALAVNKTVSLNNILFVPGSPELMETSYTELNTVLQYLNSNPTAQIKIEGHICCMARLDMKEPMLNDSTTLSQGRAKTVYTYFISKGVARNRLSYVGMGMQNAKVWPEVTQEDMQMNRRVDIRLMTK
jgi:outer membrane protein OmpA-like peptidoglycan-associated protein